MKYRTSDPMEYQLMSGCGLGMAVENMRRNPVPLLGYFDPVTGEEHAGPAPAPAAATTDETPWWAQPVKWVTEVVGNVNYMDENVRVSSVDGTITVDRSGQPITQPGAATPTIINVPTALQNVPTVAWVGGAAVLALLLLRK